MDYRFFYNERQLPCARLSMDHEAFGLWLTDELASNLERLDEISKAIKDILSNARQEYEWIGRDFVLRLNRDDAEVIALSLLQEYTEDELNDEDLELYDAESRAMCGLEDFQELLLEWRDFLL